MIKKLFKYFWVIVVSAVINLVVFPVICKADWVAFRGTADRIGYTLEGIELPLNHEWDEAVLMPGVSYSSPVAVNRSACIGSLNGDFYFSSTETKTIKFSIPTEGSIYSSPIFSDGTVYIGSADGCIYSIDNNSGEVKWKFKTGGNINSSPVKDGTLVFCASNDGIIYALNELDGSVAWTYDIGDYIWSSPAVQNGILCVGSYNGIIYAINTADGSLKWNYQTEGPIRSTPAIGEEIVCVSSSDGKIYVLGKPTGALVYPAVNLNEPILSSPSIVSNYIYIATRNGKMYAIADGMIMWQAPIEIGDQDHPVYSSPAVCGSFVFIGGTDGKIYAFDRLTGGFQGSYDVGSPIESSIACSSHRLYFGSEDGKFWVLVTTDNDPPVSNLSIGSPKYVSPENNLYVTGSTPFVLDASDVLLGLSSTHYSITHKGSFDYTFTNKWQASGYGLAVDSMNNIYIADIVGQCVRKYSSDGSLLATLNISLTGMGIAVDVNGNIYISAGFEGLKKYDSAGNYISTFGAANRGPCYFVAVDNGGYIYAIYTTSDRMITKFTNEGVFVKDWGGPGQFLGNFAMGIAIDSNHNVYVVDYSGNPSTDSASNRIQKFTSEGVFLLKWGGYGTEQGKFIDPTCLAIDKEDNVYVVDNGNHRIQMFDCNGDFLESWGTLGTEDGQFIFPTGIGIDDQGCVYVSDYINNRIQKFTPQSQTREVWKTCTVPRNITLANEGIRSDGQYPIKYYSIDQVGNAEIMKTHVVIMDNAPPKTAVLFGDPKVLKQIDGQTYALIAPVTTISFSPSDGLEGASCGVMKTEYKLDDGEWITYSGPLTVSSEGTYILYYFSQDFLGNTEQINSVILKVNYNIPEISVSVEPSMVTSNQDVKITVTSDKPLNEMPKVGIRPNGWLLYYTRSLDVYMTKIDDFTWEGYYRVEPPHAVEFNGSAVVEVSAEDLFGFVSRANASFVVDVPPQYDSIFLSNLYVVPNPFKANQLPVSEGIITQYFTINKPTSRINATAFAQFGDASGSPFPGWPLQFPTPVEAGENYALWQLSSADQAILDSIYRIKIHAEDEVTGYTDDKACFFVTILSAAIDLSGVQYIVPQNAQPTIIPHRYYGTNLPGEDMNLVIKTSAYPYSPVSSWYEIGPSGAAFSPPALLTIPYCAEFFPIRDQLKVWCHDKSTGQMTIIPNQEPDPYKPEIKVWVDHLSDFTVLAPKSILPALVAGITYPDSGGFIGEKIEIHGTASASMMNYYSLEYKAPADTSWQLIYQKSFCKIESGVLGVWDTTDLNGIYILRFTVVDIGLDSSSTEITVNIDNIMPTTTTFTIGDPKYDYGNGTPLVVTSSTPFVFSSLDIGAVQSGIAWVECSVDNDTSWIVISQTGEDTITGAKMSTFFIPDTYPDNQHTVYYRSVDNVGNHEDSKSVTIILDNTNPVAALIYPSKHDTGICKVINSNTASIIGNTTDIHFSSYRIELKAMRDGDTPTDWITINEAELQKETQSLGVWNTTQFTKNRWYYIRIVSNDKVNNTFIDTVSVYLGDPEVKLVFGGYGSDPGKLKYPYGVAFSPTREGPDNSGCIFVTDMDNNRVQKFSLNGAFLSSFGTQGTGNGQFNIPTGIAIDLESSCLYVSDRDNDRVQVFDLQGGFLRAFNGEAYNKKLNKPEGLAVGLFYTYSGTGCTTTKAVFVADRNNDSIKIFDTSGAYLAQLTGLSKPEGVYVDSNGSIYVTKTNADSIVVFTNSLTPTLSVNEFNHPKGILSDGRYIYVSDTNHSRIIKYNTYGKQLMEFSGQDTSPFNKPVGLAIDNEGNMFIADRENSRIVKISAPTVDETMAMRMFSLPRAAMTIKDAYAYPIPFKPNSGLGHTVINFKLYSILNVILRIYNIAGELVFEQAGITTDPYVWSVVNNWNEPVASGVYIYFLTDDTREKKLGKIVVIR